jgi:hypothetical protein
MENVNKISIVEQHHFDAVSAPVPGRRNYAAPAPALAHAPPPLL